MAIGERDLGQPIAQSSEDEVRPEYGDEPLLAFRRWAFLASLIMVSTLVAVTARLYRPVNRHRRA